MALPVLSWRNYISVDIYCPVFPLRRVGTFDQYPAVLTVSLLVALAERHAYSSRAPVRLYRGMETKHPHRHVGTLPDEYAWNDTVAGVSLAVRQMVQMSAHAF